MKGEEIAAWGALLQHCTRARGAKPGQKWSTKAESVLEKIGRPAFERSVVRWFPLVERPRTRPVERGSQWQPDPNLLLQDENADILKALAWLCAPSENAEVPRALGALALSAYRKVPQMGPRCVRLGNACVWALGAMPDAGGVGQLAMLRARIKFGTAQKGIEKALDTAAGQAGMPLQEIEEISVPAYGLQEVGVRRAQLGEFGVELVVTGTSNTELRWLKPDGKRQKSVPRAVKEHSTEELKEIKAAAADLRKMLPAQRDRIENLYLEQKTWTHRAWRERYLDHPVVGTLARRLIWKFTNQKRQEPASSTKAGSWVVTATSGTGWTTRPTSRCGTPSQEDPDEVLAWRDWLDANWSPPAVQAGPPRGLPAHRRRATTRDLLQPLRRPRPAAAQFNALCAARGWKNKLRLMVDDDYPPATRELPAWGLRAEFWVEGIGDNYGADTTEAAPTSTWPPTRSASTASAPGELRPRRRRRLLRRISRTGHAHEPLPLEEVPPLVLSEIMRDVDLFVGVASVGNDPTWADGGPDGRYRDYWTSYSFGDLSAIAQRRASRSCERLVPRLKIADRCRLDDRFLVVRGDLRTYKIHLGSGNILMEPNDQYLCIVPTRAPTTGNLGNRLFLPFEGDRTLSIILSKALMLAEDTKIKDPTILHQISS